MELVIKLFLGDTRITQGIKWWNSGCSTRSKTWTTPSKIPFPVRKNMVGQSGRGSMAFQNISYIMSVSPQNTGYTKPAWDTHSNLTLTEKKKKSCDLSFWVSVRSTAKKKGWKSCLKRARESLCTRRGNSACVHQSSQAQLQSRIWFLLDLPLTSYFQWSRKTCIPQVQSCSMFPGCLLVLRLKSLQGRAKSLRYLQRRCLLPRGLLGVRLQMSQPMAMPFQSDGAGRGKASKEKPIVQKKHSSPDPSPI